MAFSSTKKRQSLFDRLALALTVGALLAFVLAGGSFGHNLLENSHSHHHEIADGSDIGDHQHVEPDGKGNAQEMAAVHCGANLLALTVERDLSVPTGISKLFSTCPANATARAVKLEPPPPRLTS